MDARSYAKTNALTTELSLQLLGIILYILLNFMNFSTQIHERCWSTALLYCNVYIWFWYKDDTRPHR